MGLEERAGEKWERMKGAGLEPVRGASSRFFSLFCRPEWREKICWAWTAGGVCSHLLDNSNVKYNVTGYHVGILLSLVTA